MTFTVEQMFGETPNTGTNNTRELEPWRCETEVWNGRGFVRCGLGTFCPNCENWVATGRMFPTHRFVDWDMTQAPEDWAPDRVKVVRREHGTTRTVFVTQDDVRDTDEVS